MLPDVPCFEELGVDLSFQMLNVILLGPKNMDPELVKQIHDYYAAAAENRGKSNPGSCRHGNDLFKPGRGIKDHPGYADKH